MKYTLTTDTSGSLNLEVSSEFKHPFGLLMPSNQDVRYTLNSGKSIGTLISASNPTLPEGFEIFANGNAYIFSGGVWLNQIDESNADEDIISGVIHLRNNSGYDIGVSW